MAADYATPKGNMVYGDVVKLIFKLEKLFLLPLVAN